MLEKQNSDEEIRRFQELLLQSKEMSLDESREHARVAYNEIAHEMLQDAASLIGQSEGFLEKRLLPFVIEYTPDVNAKINSLDGWQTFTITLNLGIILFTSKMATLLVSRLGIVDENGVSVDEPLISFERTATISRTLMEAFWNCQCHKVSGLQITTELTEQQKMLLALICLNMRSFIIGHELGHVVFKLTRNDLDEIFLAKELMKIFFSLDGKCSDVDKQMEAKWSEEVASDLIGLRLSINRHRNSLNQSLQYASAELFFMLQNMLVEFREAQGHQILKTGTHPPSDVRLEVIRRLTGYSKHPLVSNICEGFQQILKWITESL